MASLDKEKKSSRLLASRRYTHDVLNDSQEAFTEVLDLGASEVYTQAHLIPSSSLPHSGSSQNNSTHNVSGMPITKYWYRHKLTKSNLNNEAWFFLNPAGSDSGIGAQLIDSDQQTNFISPKYSLPSLSNSTTEDATPGYLAIVYKSTSTDSGSLDGSAIVSTNDYVFDYKTGVLQFNSSTVDPSDSQYVYMTVYQYVGTTAQTGLDVSGAVTASYFKGDGSGLTGLAASYTQEDISGSLGPNANFIRNLTEAKISGSAPFTAAGISGSWQGQLSQSATIGNLTVTGTSKIGNQLLEDTQLTGSVKITGSLDVQGVFIIDGGTF